jgi:Mce-associated membrane protein
MAGVTLPTTLPARTDLAGPAYASWLARVLAFAMDSGLLALAVWLAAPGAAVPAPWPGLPSWGAGDDAARGPAAWTVAAVLVVQLALQAWTGATIGKRAVGVVVLDDRTGRPLGMLRTLWRQLLHLLDAILLVGYLRPVWHAQRRTFADSLARSVVVSDPWPTAWRPVDQRSTRVAQAVAATLGVAGLLGGLVQSGGATNRTVAQVPCVLEDGSPGGLVARVEVDEPRVWQMRLGIRRDVTSAPGTVRVVWTALPGSGWSEDVDVTASLTPNDGEARGLTQQGEGVGRLTAGVEAAVEVARPVAGPGSLDVRSRVDLAQGTVECSADLTLTAADLAGTSA